MSNIYFSKKVGYVLREPDDIYFHAMFTLLEYTGLRNNSIIEIMYNTRGYLIYDLFEKRSELRKIDSHKLLSYGLGLYYEQFCFRNVDHFKHYLLRNMKMRLSVPLVKINMSVLGLQDHSCEHVYVFCVGYNETNDELIIIHPITNEYHAILATDNSETEYEFILLNFPDMSKPKMIHNYNIRILHYYYTILNRTKEQSRWLIGNEAIQHMTSILMTTDSNLKVQLDMMNHLEMEANK
ncbi:hypothetical protein [Paenibacillus crassostreae]|uniref:Uncharacterized protein n=1 Tax=Paenibacillus crassostreae TaxID=1763538 RepID=A0A167FB64_9BACL|nr:hypothetical protein [Paenibacillus crassostreae]AOZ90861.1 hypothetical protein LPB68_00665 [Paenibacillus crassostreae]OAB76373.1 hypothetical protein PNBC_02870 [Paenibacillus crassostreae]